MIKPIKQLFSGSLLFPSQNYSKYFCFSTSKETKDEEASEQISEEDKKIAEIKASFNAFIKQKQDEFEAKYMYWALQDGIQLKKQGYVKLKKNTYADHRMFRTEEDRAYPRSPFLEDFLAQSTYFPRTIRNIFLYTNQLLSQKLSLHVINELYRGLILQYLSDEHEEYVIKQNEGEERIIHTKEIDSQNLDDPNSISIESNCNNVLYVPDTFPDQHCLLDFVVFNKEEKGVYLMFIRRDAKDAIGWFDDLEKRRKLKNLLKDYQVKADEEGLQLFKVICFLSGSQPQIDELYEKATKANVYVMDALEFKQLKIHPEKDLLRDKYTQRSEFTKKD